MTRRLVREDDGPAGGSLHPTRRPQRQHVIFEADSPEQAFDRRQREGHGRLRCSDAGERAAQLVEVDVAADGRRVRDPDELAAALAAGGTAGTKFALVRIYRVEWTPTLEVPRGHLLPGTTALDQLGISGWSHGRDWRATGFYGHYVTYAEVLQLIASLALGLFICLPFKKSWIGALVLFALAGIIFALLLTVTRASWLAFMNENRKQIATELTCSASNCSMAAAMDVSSSGMRTCPCGPTRSMTSAVRLSGASKRGFS